jgi:CDGSH-type Zn-finger protein
MPNVKIQALDNGPFMVNGEVDVADGQGKIMETKTECYLCRCGLSTNQPYCTGAHDGKFKNEVRAK